MPDSTLEAEVLKQGTCAYCGNVGDVTDDHVVPQCLWPGRVPKSAPIIDAWRRCNHIWKSEYDTYLRDALVNDIQAANSPIVQKIRKKFYRSVDRNQSAMAREFAANAQ
jgi:5-methylcytosine-specific restriction endonuclease McrA